MSSRRAFYPVEEVAKVIEKIPRGQISDRLNELILKGLSFEKQEKVRSAYLKYDAELATVPERPEEDTGVSSTMIMSQSAFQPEEDEEEDFV